MKLGEYAWYKDNADYQSHPVKSRNPNPWGLYDMHGNVFEWCLDWYHLKLPGGADPVGKSPGEDRVLRGGGWYWEADLCRSAYRYWGNPRTLRSDTVGFRVLIPVR